MPICLEYGNDLSADPPVSMATWEGFDDDLCEEEDQDLENTKLSIVSRENQELFQDFVSLVKFVGTIKKTYQARLNTLTQM